MKGPLDHIVREPLPWREALVTECGRPINDVAQIVSIDEATARWKELGAKRAAFTLCMTCIETVNRHPRFRDNPSAAVSRTCAIYNPTDEDQREWRAIALLIAGHRQEFDELVAGLADTRSLADARRVRRTAL